MDEEVKTLMTIVGRNGIVFDNFPIYHHNGEDHYVMRDMNLSEKIELSIPEQFRKAVRVDCNLIPNFQEELPDEPPTAAEKRILEWLDEIKSS